MVRVFVLLLALVLSLSGCSFLGDTAAAEQAVVKFHAMLDAGQFDAIYDGSSEVLKGMTTKSSLDAVLSNVHDKLGTVRSSTRTGWGINYDARGERITLTYKTSYSRGDAIEQFNFRKDASELLLSGYHIKPAAPAAL